MIWISIAISVIMFIIRMIMERAKSLRRSVSDKIRLLLRATKALERCCEEQLGITVTISDSEYRSITKEAEKAKRPSVPFFASNTEEKL